MKEIAYYRYEACDEDGIPVYCMLITPDAPPDTWDKARQNMEIALKRGGYAAPAADQA